MLGSRTKRDGGGRGASVSWAFSAHPAPCRTLHRRDLLRPHSHLRREHNCYPILLLGKQRLRRLDHLHQQVALLRKHTLLTSALAAGKEGG